MFPYNFIQNSAFAARNIVIKIMTDVNNLEESCEVMKESDLQVQSFSEEILKMEGFSESTEADMHEKKSATSNLLSATSPVSIGPQHFDIRKLIGEGAFGKVIFWYIDYLYIMQL